MSVEYIPPSLRNKNKNNIEILDVRRKVEKLNNSNKSRDILKKEDIYYKPQSLLKNDILNKEKDFPVLIGNYNKIDKDIKESVWCNNKNLNKIKEEIKGVEIKCDKVIDIRPEKKLKTLYYDDEIEEIIDKKVVYSRLQRDMNLGLVIYSEQDRVYIYKEKDDRARVAFYNPELFDNILKEENEINEIGEEYIEEEYIEEEDEEEEEEEEEYIEEEDNYNYNY